MSVEVRAQNTISMTSVKAIKDATDQSAQLLAEMEQYAEDAGTTLTGIYQDAEDAKANASNALASAQSASEYASRALGNLSTVQSITETLAWITAHGTMTLTTDTALDPSHVYFVRDNSGDYVVGGQHYAVVSEPNVADISTYYELSIDESLNNYVATHLAVDSEGLWIIPDAGGNKVLIATGQGSTYADAGTYIIGKANNVDTVLASFTANGIQIGNTNDAHLVLDATSQQYTDALDNSWLSIIADISETRATGYATTNTKYGDGTTKDFYTSDAIVLLESVTVDGVTKAEGIDFNRIDNAIMFNVAPANGADIQIRYSRLNPNTDTLYYTLGTRNAKYDKGMASVAEGMITVASGEASHAEGLNTTAYGRYAHAEGSGTGAWGEASHAEGQATTAGTPLGTLKRASHAEGYLTQAIASYAHAQNYGTIAGYQSQTTIGEYNDNQADTAFEIGNGTSNARSNAFVVDWGGNSEQQGHATTADMTSQEIDDFVDSIGGGDTIADVVVEADVVSGTNGKLRWHKWSSGRLEIDIYFRDFTLTSYGTSAVIGGYGFNYPLNWVNSSGGKCPACIDTDYTVTTSWVIAGGHAVPSTIFGRTTSGCTLYALGEVGSTQSIQLNIHIVGEWK